MARSLVQHRVSPFNGTPSAAPKQVLHRAPILRADSERAEFDNSAVESPPNSSPVELGDRRAVHGRWDASGWDGMAEGTPEGLARCRTSELKQTIEAARSQPVADKVTVIARPRGDLADLVTAAFPEVTLLC
jgi:hypothetical protein